ncbi:hypothetical protein ACFVR1_11945 [Psychrobacillus sp. NPDC058041]|uniref:hypothetical protein n=1 Tax=Psychrobacillus sp. NPDC058041 TaxID=3346310 RepID=UPI0036DCACF6
MREVLLTIIFLVFMGGCASKDNVKKIEIAQMIGFSEAITYPSMKITKTEEIEEFINAFNSAEKVPGIANTVNPDYQVIIGTENYYLWISDESGTIMNIKDTHTVYSLSESSAQKIFDLLNTKKD